MKKVKWLILGAEPSELKFVNCLTATGENDYMILEAKSEAGAMSLYNCCRGTS